MWTRIKNWFNSLVGLQWLTAFFTWFGKAFGASDEVSIKRISAFFVIVVDMLIIVLGGFGVIKTEYWTNIQSLVIYTFSGALALLGITTLIDHDKIKAGIPTDTTSDAAVLKASNDVEIKKEEIKQQTP